MAELVEASRRGRIQVDKDFLRDNWPVIEQVVLNRVIVESLEVETTEVGVAEFTALCKDFDLFIGDGQLPVYSPAFKFYTDDSGNQLAKFSRWHRIT